MSASTKPEPFRLGFLAAIEVADRGYVGGLLVTNHLGRPLEFQCTTPVKPNRTQQILYGPTLGPYVLADLIGRTLVEKAAVKPHLLLVEEAALLELRRQVEIAVAWLQTNNNAEGTSLGQQVLQIHDDFDADLRVMTRGQDLVPRDADLREPFERVREALSETLAMAQAAA
jgi:hypothetical protein